MITLRMTSLASLALTVGLGGAAVLAGPAQAVEDGGAVAGWGWNRFGEAPELMASPEETVFTQVTTGTYHSLGLTADGTVVGWGRNADGQMLAPEGVKFVQIAAGDEHSVGVTDTGTVVGWGSNEQGQAPGQVTPPAGTKFVQVAAGTSHSVGLTDAGTVVAWGTNSAGQAPELVTPPEGTKFVQVATGWYHTLALTDTGSVVGWGSDSYDQTVELMTAPEGKTFTQISAGAFHSMALTDAGTVVAWGRNNHGYERTAPPGTKFIQVAGGHDHSLALTDAGTVVGWGSNSYGQAPALTTAPQGTKFIQIAAYWHHSIALLGPDDAPPPGDTTPPLVDLSVTPNPVLQHLPAIATFTASDEESGIASATCPPQQAVDTSVTGTFMLECSAANGAGLVSDPMSVTFTVLSPSEGLFQLRATVIDYKLGTVESSLTALLDGAAQNLAKANTAGAIDKLNSFIARVDAQTGKKIATAKATELVTQAQNIIASLRTNG